MVEDNIILDLCIQNCLYFQQFVEELFSLLLLIRSLNKFYKNEIDTFLFNLFQGNKIYRRNKYFLDIELNIKSYYLKYLLKKNKKIRYYIDGNHHLLNKSKLNSVNNNCITCFKCKNIINSSIYLIYYDDLLTNMEFIQDDLTYCDEKYYEEYYEELEEYTKINIELLSNTDIISIKH